MLESATAAAEGVKLLPHEQDQLHGGIGHGSTMLLPYALAGIFEGEAEPG